MGLLDFLRRNRGTDSPPSRDGVPSASEQGDDRLAGAEISYLDSEALRFWAKKQTDYEIPSYYSQSEFGRNVLPALHRLLDGGYLEISDIETNISLKTIPDLKAILEEHELKTTGKKGELVQRILNNIPIDELEAIFPVGKYKLTEKGKFALVPYEVFDINKRYSLGISHYRLIKKKNENPNASPEDLIKSLLEEDMKTCYRENDRAKYPAVLSNASTFFQSIGEYKQSLACYCLVFFIWQSIWRKKDNPWVFPLNSCCRFLKGQFLPKILSALQRRRTSDMRWVLSQTLCRSNKKAAVRNPLAA